ncbi:MULTISPECIES: SdrD B-like domain-containing protein [unclassified Roseitalea]|uniref:SdrD B-like domain-containing protein n=1 Tax=unclassified Roseitalea TaxID=2639107 RepID=UPI00273FD19A|nr:MULTISPECIES: SdrD B-like domain-containing protein [unclassified Roseitalea]
MPSIVRGLCGALIVLFFAIASARADMPPAGAQIHAQAQATYFNPALGIVEQVFSNTAVIVINELPAIAVDADQTILASPGVIGQFVFFVENIGNVPLNPAIDAVQQTGDDLALHDVLIFRDVNGDGAIDGGEPSFAGGGAISLGPGERASFIVRFQMPSGASVAEEGLIDLVAQDPAEAVGDLATGTARTSEGGLVIAKRAQAVSVAAGDVLDYALELRNNGLGPLPPAATLEGETLTIDGVARAGVIVRDAIPQNTQFAGADGNITFRPIYHAAATGPKHSYTTTPPPAGEVDAVAFLYDPDGDVATPDAFPAGFSNTVRLSVTVNANAGGLLLENRAEGYQPVGTGEPESFESNRVQTPVTGQGGTLAFMDQTFASDIETMPVNANAWLQVNAGVCNRDGAVAETISITLDSTPEFDREAVTATETGPNTGVFRSAAVPVQDQVPAARFNGVVSALANTLVTATLSCGTTALTDTLVVNPGGFVFNALSNAPVPNAQVTLLSATGTPVDQAVTDQSGFYRFADVPPGSYRIAVLDPGGLAFPSQRTVFPGYDRNVDPLASYGEAFAIASAGPFGVDIPLDPGAKLDFAIDKTADRDRLERGEFIRYAVQIANRSEVAMLDLALTDTLPAGFAYLEGTAQIDGAPLADPTGGVGPELWFDLSALDLGPGDTLTVSYVARVTSSAALGEAVNSAVATGRLPALPQQLVSNTARHIVRVEATDGVFADEGVVLGTVFVDVNGNGVRDVQPGQERIEPGVPGVRIYLQNGAVVITDPDGNYSLPGLRPVTHVFAVDGATLPAGTSVLMTRTRDALAPGTRFVDLKRGEIRQEDFAIGPGTGAVLDAVIARAGNHADDGFALPATDLALGGTIAGAGKSRRAESLTSTQVTTRAPRADGEAEVALDTDHGKAIESTVDLEALTRELSPELAFLDLEDGDILNDDDISIRIKGPAAVRLKLEVNGQSIGAERIGQRTMYQAGGVQAAEFIAVRLKGGANELRLVQTDPFGNDRGGITITVYAPGKPTALEIIAPPTALADPATAIPVLVRAIDEEGRPTRTPIEVTLDPAAGRFDVTDIRLSEPGTQVFIDRGQAIFDYYPPALSGTQTITVRSGLGTHTADIRLTPDLDQRLAVGIIEGAVRFGEGGASLAPLIEDDQLSGFEDTIEGVRGALYLKGRIRGDALLTLRYESDRDTEDRLFRDIDPDAYYPVYGDSAERGFDAQSNSQLYVKVEKGLSYVLYGDITVGPQSDAIELGGYSRSVTGAHAHIERDRLTVDLFAAYTDQSQVVREFPARGISGPYALDLTGYIDGSERVEIVAYDRDQPEVAISAVTLRRNTDYTLDFFADTIIFARPVMATDDNLNPQFIRVTYEVDSGTERYWIIGGEIGLAVTDTVTIGYREVRSMAEAPEDDDRTVRAGYVEADLGRYGRLEVEAAQSEDHLGRIGEGYRARYELEGKRGRLSVAAADTDVDFDPPGATIGPGRTELRIEAALRGTKRLDLEGEALYSRDKPTGEERYGVEGRAKLRLNEQIDAVFGARYSVTDRPGEPAPSETWSGIVGLDIRSDWLPGARLGLEYEQALDDASRRRWLLEADYRVNDRVRVYGKTELSSSTSGLFGLSDFAGEDAVTSRAGIEVTWNEHVSSYAEHREGGDGGIAGGLDWRWTWNDHHDLTASFEHVEPLSEDHRRNTAITLGYGYQNEDGTTLFELRPEWSRTDDGTQNWYASASLGKRFGDITVLARNRFAYTDAEAGERTRNRARLGAAWRPGEHNRWSALAWYGFEYDDDRAAETRELAHSWSLGGEYRLNDDLRIRARHAGRHLEQRYDGLDLDSTVLLGTAGFEWDAHERVVLGLNGTVFVEPDIGAAHYGLGGEIGFVPAKNTLVSLGYSWADIERDKIEDIHRTGFYLRVRAKIDEGIWDLLDRMGIGGQ